MKYWLKRFKYSYAKSIFKPSFGKHTTFEYKINLAKTLADWEATEKVTEYVSKKFNVVLKTEFDGNFIEECYGKGNMTYVDPNKEKFEKNKARTEAMMSKEKYSEWKKDIENLDHKILNMVLMSQNLLFFFQI